MFDVDKAITTVRQAKFPKIFLGAFAAIAIVCLPACAIPLQFTVDDTPAPSAPLALDNAQQYLGDPNFYGQTWDPALMALATGSTDPAYRNIVDVRRFQGQEQMPDFVADRHQTVMLDAGPMACNGGFALRTVDGFGRIQTVRVTAIPVADPTSQGGRFAKLMEMSQGDGSAASDWEKQLVHLGGEVSRKYEMVLPMGSTRSLRLSAQLNTDRQAAMGTESPMNGGISYVAGKSFSMTINPIPLFDNQVIDRLNVAIGAPTASTRFSVQNIAWRRAVSYLDPSQTQGETWVAGASTTIDPRQSLSAAVSRWQSSGQFGTDMAVTDQYRTGNRVYGFGLLNSSGSVAPFASIASMLPNGGRLYLSFGAPLDDHTRVPVACRMSMAF